MHVDESKKFDKRNVERNIKNGVISRKDYESYLSRLPDASEKIFSPGEEMVDFEDIELPTENEGPFPKKGLKKSTKGGSASGGKAKVR
jgi:hypothetical protein